MGFREHLNEICRVEGAVAASVMGFDGIAIDTVSPEETSLDLETLLVEFSGLMGQVRQVAEGLHAGTLQELSVGTEALTTHLRVLNDEFFLLLAIAPEGNHGKGRFLMRINAPKLQAEL